MCVKIAIDVVHLYWYFFRDHLLLEDVFQRRDIFKVSSPASLLILYVHLLTLHLQTLHHDLVTLHLQTLLLHLLTLHLQMTLLLQILHLQTLLKQPLSAHIEMPLSNGMTPDFMTISMLKTNIKQSKPNLNLHKPILVQNFEQKTWVIKHANFTLV